MRIWLVPLLGVVLIGVVAGTLLAGKRGGSTAASPAPSPSGETDEADWRARPWGSAEGPPPGAPGARWPPVPSGQPGTAKSPAAPPATAPAGDQPQLQHLRYEPDAAVIATQERDQQVEAIRATGPDAAGLLKGTDGLARAWESLTAAGSAEVHVGKFECHRTGCFTEVLHRSAQAFEEQTSKILASDAMAGWPGAKTRSAPIVRPDGSIAVTWMLFAAQDGGTAPGAP